MRRFLIIAFVFSAVLAVADTGAVPVSVFDVRADLTPQCGVDKAVFAKLKQQGITPTRLCSDAVFLRRVYLDVIGTLPTPQEARQFLESDKPDKRAVLIDRLLERDEFADCCAMKWSDVLRIKAEFPINLWPNAAQAYYLWIWTSIKENKPYDQLARELLISSGSNFRIAAVNFYRALQSREPEALGRAAALAFMGERAEKWDKERLANLAGFFEQVGFKDTAEWKEEVIFFDPGKTVTNSITAKTGELVFPDGTSIKKSSDKDPREVFADWLMKPGNPWFARNIVNRIWYWLLGRGIIHEPDDIRSDNPASNPELLALLEKELVDSKYDLKHIYRIILNSNTYQLSSIPGSDNAGGDAYFAKYPVRQLEAEVLIDAICQITGSTEEYSSLIPEPFTFIPEDLRSIKLPDGSISSSFLELFSRPSRDTGLLSERSINPTSAQRLHILNSSHIQKKIEGSKKLQGMVKASKENNMKLVSGIYLSVLSRFPTEEELKIVQSYSKSGSAKGKEVLFDLTWALINSAEFMYKH